ncbi:MAG: hypothetical protein KF851_03970 [Pirellulaceae bacterium]|nr:hypothetical protein [Pirellulaceae bacterium]
MTGTPYAEFSVLTGGKIEVIADEVGVAPIDTWPIRRQKLEELISSNFWWNLSTVPELVKSINGIFGERVLAVIRDRNEQLQRVLAVVKPCDGKTHFEIAYAKKLSFEEIEKLDRFPDGTVELADGEKWGFQQNKNPITIIDHFDLLFSELSDAGAVNELREAIRRLAFDMYDGLPSLKQASRRVRLWASRAHVKNPERVSRDVAISIEKLVGDIESIWPPRDLDSMKTELRKIEMLVEDLRLKIRYPKANSEMQTKTDGKKQNTPIDADNLGDANWQLTPIVNAEQPPALDCNFKTLAELRKFIEIAERDNLSPRSVGDLHQSAERLGAGFKMEQTPSEREHFHALLTGNQEFLNSWRTFVVNFMVDLKTAVNAALANERIELSSVNSMENDGRPVIVNLFITPIEIDGLNGEIFPEHGPIAVGGFSALGADQQTEIYSFVLGSALPEAGHNQYRMEFEPVSTFRVELVLAEIAQKKSTYPADVQTIIERCEIVSNSMGLRRKIQLAESMPGQEVAVSLPEAFQMIDWQFGKSESLSRRFKRETGVEPVNEPQQWIAWGVELFGPDVVKLRWQQVADLVWGKLSKDRAQQNTVAGPSPVDSVLPPYDGGRKTDIVGCQNRRGRKPKKSLTRLEKRIKAAWGVGKQFDTHSECDLTLKLELGTTKAALDRIRKFEKNKSRRI